MPASHRNSEWEKRYASTDSYLFGTEPNDFLTRECSRLPAGARVLCVADGEGRNGVFLAQQGFDVHTLEASATAIERARMLARQRGVSLHAEQADLFEWNWPAGGYDAVVGIFIQFASPAERRDLFEKMKNALKPGGLLLLAGYRPEQLQYKTGGPSAIEQLYTEEMLREAFADMKIHLLESSDREIMEGIGHAGLSALIELAAEKY